MILLQGFVFGRGLIESLARKTAAPTASTARFSYRNRTQRRIGMHRVFINAINPYETRELLHRLRGCSVGHLASGTATTDSSSKLLKELLKDEVWIPVYRFRGIHYSVLAAKIKLALTVSSVTLIPFKYWQYLDDAISLNHLVSISTFASFTTLAFIFLCRLLSGLIGVISMNETNEYVRVGYLSFRGSRCNKYMKLDDVIPINESSTGINSKIVRFGQYSSNETLNLPLFNAELVDQKRASMLFGDTSAFTSSFNKMK